MNRNINALTLPALRDEVKKLIGVQLVEPPKDSTHKELLDAFRPFIDSNSRCVSDAWKNNRDAIAYPYVQANLLIFVYLVNHSNGAHPNDHRYCLASLAHCYDALGLMLESCEQLDEARRSYREAIRFMEKVVAMEGEQPTAYPEILKQYKEKLQMIL